MIRSLILSAVIMCAVSCTLGEILPPVEDDSFAEKVSVNFCAESSVVARSSITPDENCILDINVYAFRNGVLEDAAFVSRSNVTLNLYAGYSYNIYAAANMGHVEACVDESEFIENFAFHIAELNDLDDALPMFCCYQDLYIGGGAPSIDLDMQRLVSKLSLSIDKGALMEGLQVSSVRLCQCASVARPFKWSGKGGSRAETTADIMDGDYATSEDLYRLNAGEDVVFYALENCQGILLPGNNDPSLKTPQMVGEKESLCTYLEVSCVFGPEGILNGEVDYRIYLGLDSVSSFDLPGNSCVNVMLRLTDDGLKEVSWKVDADVSVRDGYANGRVSHGLHPVSDLYVGEKVLYEVVPADELLEYLGGDASGCSISFMQDGVRSDNVVVTDLQADGNVLQCELHCRRVVPSQKAGELYLYDSDRECIGCLEGRIVVKVPRMAFAEYPAWSDPEPVERLSVLPEMEVNGSPAMLYLYLVDDNGYNLNGAGSYGFDSSLFEYDVLGAGYGNSVVNGIKMDYVIPGEDVPGRAAADISVYSENAGTDNVRNRVLAEAYGASGSISVEIGELFFGLSDVVEIGCSIPPIRLTMVDNGWAKYHDCQLSVIVENISNLPLDVCVCQLIATHKSYGAVDEEYVEKNLVLTPVHYISGEFYNGAPPVYGSVSSFCTERNTDVYPLTGISTDDIIKAINYDKRGPGQMIHLIDVTVDGHGIRRGDVEFVDQVSDGSSVYDYMYYSQDAWKYSGAMLSSSGTPVSDSRTWLYEYPNLSAGSLCPMYDRFIYDGAIEMSMHYDSDYEKVVLSAQSSGGWHDGLALAVEYDGVVNGYVETYPKGTWYSSEDNYCSVELNDVVTGVQLQSDGSGVWADDGNLMEAIGRIYEFSYKDSPRPLGSNAYLHRAHPTDFELSVCYKVEGSNGKSLYPVNFDWKFDEINYYHEQDDKNYKCALRVDSQVFNVVIVSPVNI